MHSGRRFRFSLLFPGWKVKTSNFPTAQDVVENSVVFFIGFDEGILCGFDGFFQLGTHDFGQTGPVNFFELGIVEESFDINLLLKLFK